MYVNIINLTDEEKFKMYSECTKEELISMKIESEKYEKYLREELDKYIRIFGLLNVEKGQGDVKMGIRDPE